MASKQAIVGVLATIKTAFPYTKEVDEKLQARLWMRMFETVDDGMLGQAVFKALKENNTPPAIADVFEQIEKIKDANRETPEELWQILRGTFKDVDRLHYQSQFSDGAEKREELKALYESLPEEIKTYLGSVSELVSLAKRRYEDDIKFDRKNFIKSVPHIRKRADEKMMIAESKRGLLNG